MNKSTPEELKVFFSYSHKDEELRDSLAEHLAILKRNDVISDWCDRRITAGTEIDDEIDKHLQNADIILLLISSSFIASEYCYTTEMTQAMERHEKGDVRVIAVILRPCAWEDTPFRKLKALPKDGKAITKWENQDEAFLDIANEIKRVAEELRNPEPEIDFPEPDVKRNIKISVPLPVPIVRFVPRFDRNGSNFIKTIDRLLAESENQTVVLWGSGGVGKTALAAQFARSSEHSKQTVWIDAESRKDISVGILLDEIATQLGCPEIRQLQPSLKYEQILLLLTESPSIIILDNFETLLLECQYECLEFLKTNGFDALVTTRDKIAGIKNLNVFEMPQKEAAAFLDRLIEDSSFPQAFSEEIYKRIMETSERNPLVTQWIVGQIDAAQSPTEVFEELALGEGDAAERVFDRSFNLPQLGKDGQKILLALSLFTQNARRKSIRSIVGFGRDHKKFNKALKKLANLRLLSVTENSERLYLGGLTRQFAKAYLEKGNFEGLYKRKFVKYFIGFAKTHREPSFNDLDMLEEEKSNLFTTADIAVELESWNDAFSVAFNIGEFLTVRGYWEELVRICEKMLVISNAQGNDYETSGFTNNLGNISYRRGEVEKAERLYNKSLEIEKKLGDQSGIASSLHNLGIIANNKGEVEKAERLYNESLEIGKKLGDQSGIAESLNSLGELFLGKKDTERALTFVKESHDIFEKLGYVARENECKRLFGQISFWQGNLSDSERFLGDSLCGFRKLGYKLQIALTLKETALLSEEKGKKVRAIEQLQESLKLFEQLGSFKTKEVRERLEKLKRI